MGERDVEAVAGKWIRRGVGLGGERAGEVEGDFVPLAEFAGDLGGGVAGRLARDGAEEFLALSFCEGELGLAVAVVTGNGGEERDFGPAAVAPLLTVLRPDARADLDERALTDLDGVPRLVEAFAFLERLVRERANEAPDQFVGEVDLVGGRSDLFADRLEPDVVGAVAGGSEELDRGLLALAGFDRGPFALFEVIPSADDIWTLRW